MPIDVDTKNEEFFSKLLNIIDANQPDRAVEIIMGLQDIQEQLEALTNLAHAITRDHVHTLDQALDHARDLDHALDRACNIARVCARDLELDLDHARDRAHALIRTLDGSPVRTLTRLQVVIAVLDKLREDVSG